MTVDELQQRLAALNQDLTAAGAAVRITVKTADPEPQLLTRNRYRISHIEREADRVSFRLTIAERTGAWMRLIPAEFADLVADLGMRPTSPAATEYESAPIGDTTEGRHLRRLALRLVAARQPDPPNRRHPMMPPSRCRPLDEDELRALQLLIEGGQVILEPHDESWGEFNCLLETSDGCFYHVAFAEEEA